MPSAVQLKRLLMRYKYALKPRLGAIGAVPLEDLADNARLLGVEPLQVKSKHRLRAQIGKRMNGLGMGSVLSMRKGELLALLEQLLVYARAMGGPPTSMQDPRWLPTDVEKWTGIVNA